MEKKSFKRAVEGLLGFTDIKIGGDNPWDPKVTNEKFYQRVLSEGSLGLGESYMDGWWECEALDQFFDKLLDADLDKKVKANAKLVAGMVQARMKNLQSPKRAFHIGKAHYDTGNDLYQAMLGNTMAYSCGYWKEADNLDQAQEAKLDLICKKIGLKAGDHVLDVGGGWGSFAKFAAEKYSAKVTAITVSKEQAALGKERCQGLPVEIRYQDYRDLNEEFDHIISVGMIEHVGYKNYRSFMEVTHRCLKDDGFLLLHTIGGNKSVHSTDAWIGKYIFPNSMLPSAAQLTKAFEGIFVLEDWHSFGQYYDNTLMAWHKKFNDSWESLKGNYDERFFRMWNYYLLCCAGSFRCQKNRLWQLTLSKRGVRGHAPDGSWRGGYQTVR